MGLCIQMRAVSQRTCSSEVMWPLVCCEPSALPKILNLCWLIPQAGKTCATKCLLGGCLIAKDVSESRSQLDPCELAVSSEEIGVCGFLKRQKDRWIGVFARLEETFRHPFKSVQKAVPSPRQGHGGAWPPHGT